MANKPKKNLGKPCVLNTECKSSNCVDGKCARLTEKLFRKQLSISPTFLQSALKQGVNKPGDYIVELDKNDGYPDKLFQDSDSAMGEGKPVRPTHKLRITSKKSRRRFDINVIFSYKKVTDYKEIPEGAELIYEARAKTNNQWELINKLIIPFTADEIIAFAQLGGTAFMSPLDEARAKINNQWELINKPPQ